MGPAPVFMGASQLTVMVSEVGAAVTDVGTPGGDIVRTAMACISSRSAFPRPRCPTCRALLRLVRDM